ncbi:MAG: flagellar brake protein [Zoogloeaceae bacterium]|uniref:flagellar brake protein n=1 Tax=Denitromonas sp. TaxID=2734609 RepID=UPI001D675F58|nr:flagellar brake protein [Rhodocyclaceae bacterium]MCP5220245.1 flagellar brake protein [Zoogloeaceae bacterium]
MPYERIKDNELQVGQPAPWSLYDQNNQLLLARGSTVESPRQLEQLMLRGLFRKLDIRDSATSRPDTRSDDVPTREEIKCLDEIKLTIGDTLHLQTQTEGGRVRYAVKLIGFLRGKGLIVSTPMQDGKVLLMRDGQGFVVRVFSGKSVYAFSTSTFKVANVPYPHLHLTWPREVRGLAVRSGARAKVKLIAAVRDASNKSGAASLSNLSTGGCSLSVKNSMGVISDRLGIKFRVTVNDVEQYIDLEGIIRSISHENDANGVDVIQYGIQFVDIPAGDQLALTAYVYRALFEESAGA